MKKVLFFVLLLVFVFCLNANADWVKGVSLTRTRIYTDTIPTTATTNSINTSGFDGILVEASSCGIKILRPYAWVDAFGKYVPISSSPAISTIMGSTHNASRANITITTGACIFIIPNTYGYSNVIVPCIKTFGANVGRNITYTITPVQDTDYQR